MQSHVALRFVGISVYPARFRRVKFRCGIYHMMWHMAIFSPRKVGFAAIPGPAQIFQCHMGAIFDMASDVASDMAILAIDDVRDPSKSSQL